MAVEEAMWWVVGGIETKASPSAWLWLRARQKTPLTLLNTGGGGGAYGPANDITLFLAPLMSKLSADTFLLFLNIPQDHFRPIKHIRKKN